MIESGKITTYIYKDEIVFHINITYTLPVSATHNFTLNESISFEFSHWIWRKLYEKSIMLEISKLCKKLGIEYTKVHIFTRLQGPWSSLHKTVNHLSIKI